MRQPKNPFHPGEILLEEFFKTESYHTGGFCQEAWLDKNPAQ
jgi:Plasmid maintenance system antidote protein